MNLFNIIPNKYNEHFGGESYFLNKEKTNEKLSIIIADDIDGIVNTCVIAMKKFLIESKLIVPLGLKWEGQTQLSAILYANSGMNLDIENLHCWDGYKPFGLIAQIELNSRIIY